MFEQRGKPMDFLRPDKRIFALMLAVSFLLCIFFSSLATAVDTTPDTASDVRVPGPYFDPEISADNRTVHLSSSDGQPKDAEVDLSFKAVGQEALTTVSQDVVFIVDWSRSMDLIDPNYVRSTAVKNYIDDMARPDRGAVVKFSVGAEMKAALTRNHYQLKSAISEEDEPGGGTNFEEAISISTDELIENGNPDKQWVQIILTDGRPTENVTMNTMRRVWNNQISIFTIGLGNQMDGSMLRWIANSTGGEYFHIGDAEDLLDTYLNISDQVHTSLAGRNITVRLDFSKYVDLNLDNFSLEPSSISFDQGAPSVYWDLSRIMKLGDRWRVSFSLSVNRYGWVSMFRETSGIYYVRPWDGKTNYTSIPQYSIYGMIQGSAPPPPPPTSSPPPPPPVDTFPVPSSSLSIMSTTPQTQPVSLFVAVFVALGIGEAVKSRLKISEKRAIKMHSGQEPTKEEKEESKSKLGYTCNER